MSNLDSRRSFLLTAPLVAAFGLVPEHASAEPAGGVGMATPPVVPFQVFSAAKLAESEKTLAAKPGNDNLVAESKGLPVTVVMTVEEKKAAKEFEWHEGRDHILQVLAGTTVYELGGTPEGAHSSKPGEWNSPTSAGSVTLTLNKGDMLVIPRNTPHKRSTESSVTFLLISPMGAEA